jgi:hypothetical protein
MKILKKDTTFFLLFFLLGIISRYVLATTKFIHLDAVQYAIGTFHYSLLQHTPTPPGYFLYIMSAKFLNIFFHDPQRSLVTLSILYSGLIAGVFYLFGKTFGGMRVGIIAATLFITSPLYWYKGVTIFGYLNSGFFILLMVFFCYRVVVQKKAGDMIWASVCFAILLGVRPQELIILIPLYLYVLCHTNLKTVGCSVLIFFALCFIWFVPLIYVSGGFDEYIKALSYGRDYLTSDSIFGGGGLSKVNNHLDRILINLQWLFFLGIVPLVYYLPRFFFLPKIAEDKKVQFFAVWMFPCLIYNIFLQFGEIGHGMHWGLGFVLILAEGIVIFYEDLLKMFSLIAEKVSAKIPDIINHSLFKGVTFAGIIGPIILVNLFLFFHDFSSDDVIVYSEKQFNYAEVSKTERFLDAKINFIKENFLPEETLIIASSAFFRQVMYYFPDAVVIQSSGMTRKNENTIQYGKNYQRTYYKNKGSFNIPPEIKKGIIFDDFMIPFVNNTTKPVEHRISRGYKLMSFDLESSREIFFGYNTITVL